MRVKGLVHPGVCVVGGGQLTTIIQGWGWEVDSLPLSSKGGEGEVDSLPL